MGYRISWLASRGIERAEILRTFGLHPSGETSDYPSGSISGTALPNEFYVIYLNDCYHPFVTVDHLSRCSRRCEIVGCQVDETCMISAAFSWKHGKRQWNVVHESDIQTEHLDVEGSPPDSLHELVEAAAAQQRHEHASPAFEHPALVVDHYFSVPITLANSIVGFAHDRVKFEWGAPTFERLRQGVVS